MVFIKLGICAPPSKAEEIAQMGCDFLEWPVSPVVGKASAEDIERLSRLLDELPLRPEAWNILFPPEIQLVGPAVDTAAIRQYLAPAFAALAKLGGQVVVLGSGRSRRIPEGFDREIAVRQFLAAAKVAGDLAGENGLQIALEPLNYKECNLLNTVAEGYQMLQELQHPNVGLLADLYHMEMGGEPPTAPRIASDKLWHVHIAVTDQRVMPGPNQGEDSLRAFFKTLKLGGYDGRISVEGKLGTNVSSQLDWLREVWRTA